MCVLLTLRFGRQIFGRQSNETVNMPLENLEDEGLEKNPDLQLAQWKFLLTTEKFKNDRKIKNDLLDAVKEDSKYCFLQPSRSPVTYNYVESFSTVSLFTAVYSSCIFTQIK